MDFIHTIERVLNKEFEINYKELQPGDVPSTFADVSQLEKDHQYKPDTAIYDGIKKFIDWYLDYYNIVL